MKFDKYLPSNHLTQYIKYYVVSENSTAQEYKVFPISGLVLGFQYRGELSIIKKEDALLLDTAGITGLTDTFKVFRNSTNIGTILVYFTEMGFSHFITQPVNELFNISTSLNHFFDKNSIDETNDRLSTAQSDLQRINIVEEFLHSQLKDNHTDTLVFEAIRLIYESKGAIRIKALCKQLCISQSPFEKRFRRFVGASPKKFASTVRFNSVLKDFDSQKSFSEVCFDNGYFDTAHFIKDFKQYTGDTPEHFLKLLQ